MAKRACDFYDVFPTRVGVNLLATKVAVELERIPHACGGEPDGRPTGEHVPAYSPRVWG